VRQFVSAPAVRANVPLLVALIGPSGGGKTFSAHRLARGIQRVQPGPIFGIDTEGKRMAELADRFEFQRVEFTPPFGSLDYMAAIQHCVSKGSQTVIIDSMSHEHEGPGGMLESAERIIEEKIARKVEQGHLQKPEDWKWDKERDKLKLGSFIKPKADRQKLIQYLLQLHCNVIMCFRAKEKIRPRPGNKDGPEQLGWMPIGGDEFWYEMTVRMLLLPGANGVPATQATGDGERLAMRIPEQFATVCRGQINEEMGERMAKWAAGNPVGDLSATLAQFESAADEEALRRIAQASRGMQWTEAERVTIKKALGERQTALRSGAVPGQSEEKQDGTAKQ
jgi:hypothetical protein